MLKTDTCKKYLLQKNLDDSKIEELRDTLTAIVREIISKNIKLYEKDTRKTI